MSKQHLIDMLKCLASGDEEGAAAQFSKHSTEKATELLARDEDLELPSVEVGDSAIPAPPNDETTT